MTVKKINVGINLAQLDYYSDNWVNNLVKSSPGYNFQPNGTGITFDSNGWVNGLPSGTTYTLSVFVPPNFSGNLQAVWQGSGNVNFRNQQNVTINKTLNTNVATFAFDASQNPLFIDVSSIDPNNYPREFSVIDVAKSREALFNSNFLTAAQPFNVVRCLDLQKINNSNVVNWSDNTQFNYYSWLRPSGVPIEVLVDIASSLQTNLWVQIPHQATDDYVQQFASYIKANFNYTKLKIYIEYSNEVWNPDFQQYYWVTQQAQNAGISRSQWLGQRNNDVFTIFKNTLGANNVIAVLGSWIVNPDPVAIQYAPLTDAVAIAPYLYYYPQRADLDNAVNAGWFNEPSYSVGLDAIFNQIIPAIQTTITNQLVAWKTYLKQNYPNLQLLCYEGGQSLVADSSIHNDPKLLKLFRLAQDDPRIGKAYKILFELLIQNNVSLFNQFNLLTPDTIAADGTNLGDKYGNWGLLNNYANLNTVKYQTVLTQAKLANF